MKKAKLKIDYGLEAKKGEMFPVVEEFETFVALKIGDKTCDFGRSVVEILPEEEK